MAGMAFFNRPMSSYEKAQWSRYRRYGGLPFVAVFTACYLIAACLVIALVSLSHGRMAFSLPKAWTLLAGLITSIIQALILERRYKATLETLDATG
jgi:hypothetical protein